MLQPDGLHGVKAAALDLRARIDAIKKANSPEVGAWNPYDPLGTVWNLDRCLTGERRSILSEVAGSHVADLGAGDGEMGFLLEQLGAASVDLFDNPPTSMNGFTGAQRLKTALGSGAQIFLVDFDERFALQRHYDLALVFGLLYHLKNPFYFLERVAAHAKIAILSTKITARAGADRINIGNAPMAYLLDRAEANNDATNFWVFSATGLRLLLDRSGWDVLDFCVLGAADINSDPSSANGDQRAFCMLRSRAF